MEQSLFLAACVQILRFHLVFSHTHLEGHEETTVLFSLLLTDKVDNDEVMFIGT